MVYNNSVIYYKCMNLATQTKNFLSSFRLSAEGWGEEPDKEMQGSFWVCPRESASAAEALSSAIGAYEKISSHHARGACEVSQGFCKNRFWRNTIEAPDIFLERVVYKSDMMCYHPPVSDSRPFCFWCVPLDTLK